jgi:ubiquinone/menaquinone biosynthesis C-methylase UbiE
LSILDDTEYSRFRAGNEAEIDRLELQERTFERSISKQISLLGIKHGTVILDAGCGTGSFSRAVSQIVTPAIVNAVDIEPRFVVAAQRFSREAGIRNIDFKVGDIYNLDFSNQSFDVAYCKFVLPHLKDPIRAVAELVRVTKKGERVASFDEGDLYIYPPGSLDKFFGLFAKLGRWRESTQSANTTKKRQVASSIFHDSGLQNVTVFPLPIFASSSENPEELEDLTAVPLQMIDIYKNELFSKGFMNDVDYKEGIDELEGWLEKPNSFWMALNLLTVGVL